MENNTIENIFKNIIVIVLAISSFSFGLVANIISKYSGSYFSIMTNTGVANFLITFTPILFSFVSIVYLFYILNRGSN